MQEFTQLIQGPVGQLEVRLSKPTHWQTNRPFLVCAHPHPLHGGTLTNKVVHTLAKTAAESGLFAVRFNFRGVGQSEGSFDHGKGEQQDLLSVVHWMRQQYPQAPCWLSGFSFGAYIATACHLTAAAQALLLVAPALHLYDVSQLQLSHVPTLILMGKQDEIVPPQHVQQWFDQQDTVAKLKWFEDTGHFFHGKLGFIQDACKQFIQEQLAK